MGTTETAALLMIAGIVGLFFGRMLFKGRTVVYRRCPVCDTAYPEGEPCPNCGNL